MLRMNNDSTACFFVTLNGTEVNTLILLSKIFYEFL